MTLPVSFVQRFVGEIETVVCEQVSTKIVEIGNAVRGRVVFERDNFSPNNPAFGWDGRVNGKLADPSVYIYTVEVMCENGVPYSYKGNVTLL